MFASQDFSVPPKFNKVCVLLIKIRAHYFQILYMFSQRNGVLVYLDTTLNLNLVQCYLSLIRGQNYQLQDLPLSRPRTCWSVWVSRGSTSSTWSTTVFVASSGSAAFTSSTHTTSGSKLNLAFFGGGGYQVSQLDISQQDVA